MIASNLGIVNYAMSAPTLGATYCIEDVDYDACQPNRMIMISAENDNAIRLTGSVWASVSDSFKALAGIDVSLENNLYRTDAGRYVCQWVNRITTEKGVKLSILCMVSDKIDDIKKFLGQNLLAHKLYKAAGIENWVQANDGSDGLDIGYEDNMVERDLHPSIRFKGNLIARFDSRSNNSSGTQECLSVFIMPNGKYISSVIIVNSGLTAFNHYYAEVCDNLLDIDDFFVRRSGTKLASAFLASVEALGAL